MRLLIAMALLINPAALHWEEKARLPQPRAGYVAGSVSGKLLLAGGSYWENGLKHWSNRADFFNPQTNEWSSAPLLPEARSDAASVAVNGVLYVFGGGVETTVRRDALAFQNGRWNQLPDAELPEPLLYSVAAAVGTRIYLSGGITEAGNYKSGRNDFSVWDTARPKAGWQKLPPVPGQPRFTHAMAAFKNRVYVFGGATAGGSDVQNLDDAYVFNLGTKLWKRLPDLPMARRAWSAVEYHGDLFLLGGYTNTYETEVYRFDLKTNQLHSAGMLPHPYAAAIFVNVGGGIVVSGGETADHVRAPWTIVARSQ